VSQFLAGERAISTGFTGASVFNLNSKPLNFILFQAVWFSCVLGAVYGRAWIGIAAAIFTALVSVAGAESPQKRGMFILLVTLIGTLGDLVPLWLGAFAFTHPAAVPWGYPLWMSAIWLGFATTLPASLGWLAGRLLLSALFGFLGGPLAYLAGESLGAIVLGSDRVVSLLAIGIFWAMVTPFLMRLSKEME